MEVKDIKASAEVKSVVKKQYPTPDENGEELYKASKPINTIPDKWLLLPAFLKAMGLVKQHIDSFNHFINVEIKNIVKAKANCLVTSDADPNFYLRYLNVHVGRPNLKENMITTQSTPQMCRIRDVTYASPILVDVEYRRGNEVVFKQGTEIGRLPIMLKSDVCWLSNKDVPAIHALGECPYDPGGYFIVKGTEKVILMQEQLSKNRIIVEVDSKHNICAVVQSSTNETKARTTVVHKNGKLYVRHNSFADDIPLCIVLRALGVETDQEMLQLVGTEARHLSGMALAVQDSHEAGVLNSKHALVWIGNRMKTFKGNEGNSLFGGSNNVNRAPRVPRTPEEDALEALHRVVLAHVEAEGSSLLVKGRFLCLMARRVLDAVEDSSLIDDRDYLGNKRLELAGQLMALMFEDLFKRFNSDLKKQIDNALLKYQQSISSNSRAAAGVIPPDVFRSPSTELITRGIQHALSSGNWNIKRFKMERSGVAQVLNRLSYVATVGMMTRVASQFEKSRKVSGPRALQPSQWGMLCPCDTPEGEACGLVKNLALLTHITNDMDDKKLIRLCYCLGVESASVLAGEEINSPGTFTVFCNGELLGVHTRPKQFINSIREMRRTGLIGQFISIFENSKQQAIYIASDGGRLCRPLIVVEKGRPRLKATHIESLKAGSMSFNDFIKKGILEWVDVNEENDLLIALREENLSRKTTHLEIDPLTLLGAVAGLIPYPHHNQSPRNTYQCAMGKQAMGAIACNQFNRCDTILYLLVYPQRPLCKTRTIELMNFEKLPAGHNASVAIMSYSGYDIEDATVLNRSSLDRGYGRSYYLRRVSVALTKYLNGTSDRAFPPPIATAKGAHGDKKKSNVLTNRRYDALDDDGVVRVGEQLQDGMIYLNKYSPLNTRDPVMDPSKCDASFFRPTPSVFKGTNPVYVDRVIATSAEDDVSQFKFMFRQLRRPELGDKFSSRHGQKGVIGLIVGQEDLPFSETGWNPDVVMNPHGFPSRMTVGKMLELIAGKAALLDGKFRYGSIFGGDKYEDLARTLIKHGYHYSGKECLLSGITGEAIPSYVFVGPIFYQRLKHMVQDKIHARGRGPRQVLTRQPTEGRAKEGGLRLGEMERDCLVAYGAGSLLLERLLLSSDAFVTSVCGTCGLMGYLNYCPGCKTSKTAKQVQLPYACKLLFQELMTMNVCPRLKVKEV